MKKLIATMCAFALVIPCVLGFAACKKDGPIKVSGKTFVYDHVEFKFDSEEQKESYFHEKTEKQYKEEYDELAAMNAFKFTKTEFFYGSKSSADAKEYDFSDDKLYYKQSKDEITLYEDAGFKTIGSFDGLKFHTTTEYLITDQYIESFGLKVITYHKVK